jgi:hypothetical protein
MSFPLYETLITGVPDKKLTLLQKKELMKKISALSQETHELVYCIIRRHSNLENMCEETKAPYNAVITGTEECADIEFDINSLPLMLQQVLYKFMNIHYKNLKEQQLFNQTKE